jgi:hypothetical protein
MMKVKDERFKVQGWKHVLHLTLHFESCPLNLLPWTLDLNYEY